MVNNNGKTKSTDGENNSKAVTDVQLCIELKNQQRKNRRKNKDDSNANRYHSGSYSKCANTCVPSSSHSP